MKPLDPLPPKRGFGANVHDESMNESKIQYRWKYGERYEDRIPYFHGTMILEVIVEGRLAWRENVTEEVDAMVRWCALKTAHLWNCPTNLRAWLEGNIPFEDVGDRDRKAIDTLMAHYSSQAAEASYHPEDAARKAAFSAAYNATKAASWARCSGNRKHQEDWAAERYAWAKESDHSDQDFIASTARQAIEAYGSIYNEWDAYQHLKMLVLRRALPEYIPPTVPSMGSLKAPPRAWPPPEPFRPPPSSKVEKVWRPRDYAAGRATPKAPDRETIKADKVRNRAAREQAVRDRDRKYWDGLAAKGCTFEPGRPVAALIAAEAQGATALSYKGEWWWFLPLQEGHMCLCKEVVALSLDGEVIGLASRPSERRHNYNNFLPADPFASIQPRGLVKIVKAVEERNIEQTLDFRDVSEDAIRAVGEAIDLSGPMPVLNPISLGILASHAVLRRHLLPWCLGAGLKSLSALQGSLAGVNLSHLKVSLGDIPWDFRGADLRGADFHGARLQDADFRGARLYGARFTHADLLRADFRGCDLYGVSFLGARLEKADFTDAELGSVDLSNTDLMEAKFGGCSFEFVKMRDTIIGARSSGGCREDLILT